MGVWGIQYLVVHKHQTYRGKLAGHSGISKTYSTVPSILIELDKSGYSSSTLGLLLYDRHGEHRTRYYPSRWYRLLHTRHVHSRYASVFPNPVEPMLTIKHEPDDIDFGGSRPAVKNVLGGAASFAVVGARLVAGSAHARAVSWIVDVGSDFPPETLGVIRSWDTDCVIREDHSRLTTRAWNGYHPNEKRGEFKPAYKQNVQE